MLNGPRALALRAIALLDLTDLSDDCTADRAVALAERAAALDPHPAAVCIWPEFVRSIAAVLAESDVRIATVVNFPAGGEDVAQTLAETRRAVADGAHEIDLALPWRALLEGRGQSARDMVAAVREALPRGVLLKVILESGELKDGETIAAASRLAIHAGADMLKTSTGKTPVSATPEAARVMLGCIRDSGRPVGFKASGGLRTFADAVLYLGIADEIMGADWATPSTFRFGASGLLDVLLKTAQAGRA